MWQIKTRKIPKLADLLLEVIGLYPFRDSLIGYGKFRPLGPKLPIVLGYRWATLSPGAINTVTWSTRLCQGRQRLAVKHHMSGNKELEAMALYWAVAPYTTTTTTRMDTYPFPRPLGRCSEWCGPNFGSIFCRSLTVQWCDEVAYVRKRNALYCT